MSRVQMLYQLQRLDLKIAQLKRRYKTIQTQLGESQALIEARHSLQEAEAKLKQWRTTLRNYELDIATVREKQVETEKNLYSGRIKSPKELSDMEKESEYLKRRQASLEEKALEAMSQVEVWTRQLGIAQEHWTVVETAWQEEHAELVSEQKQLKQELAQWVAKRKAWASQISPQDCQEYESLRKIRQGVAVSSVSDQTCQVCHIQIPVHLIDQARVGDQLVYCNGCERILYIPQ